MPPDWPRPRPVGVHMRVSVCVCSPTRGRRIPRLRGTRGPPPSQGTGFRPLPRLQAPRGPWLMLVACCGPARLLPSPPGTVFRTERIQVEGGPGGREGQGDSGEGGSRSGPGGHPLRERLFLICEMGRAMLLRVPHKVIRAPESPGHCLAQRTDPLVESPTSGCEPCTGRPTPVLLTLAQTLAHRRHRGT